MPSVTSSHAVLHGAHDEPFTSDIFLQLNKVKGNIGGVRGVEDNKNQEIARAQGAFFFFDDIIWQSFSRLATTGEMGDKWGTWFVSGWG